MNQDENLNHVVWQLAAPTLVEMVLISLMGMADMIQCGRLGPAAITSIGLTNQPIMLLQAVFQALNVGTTALVARFIGMKRPDRASDTLRQTFCITLLLGAVFSVLSGLFAKDILEFMGAEPDVIEVGTPYFQVVACGFVFSSVAMAIASALRGAGDTKTPMRINLAANGLNVILNTVLIWGHFGLPALGVFGAGLATTLSRFVAAAWFTAVVTRGDKALALDLRKPYRPDREIIGKISAIGLPAAVEQLVSRSGMVAFAKIISSLGTATFAAHQVSMNILNLTDMPGMALGTSSTTLVGQSLGAERPDQAEKYANAARNMGFAAGIAMTFAFFFFGKDIAWLYTDDATVIAASALVLRIYAVALPVQSSLFTLTGALRGAGDTTYPLYASIAGIWAGRVALGWVLATQLNMGLTGAWIGLALDHLIRTGLIYLRFRTGKWKTIGVWRDSKAVNVENT